MLVRSKADRSYSQVFLKCLEMSFYFAGGAARPDLHGEDLRWSTFKKRLYFVLPLAAGL